MDVHQKINEIARGDGRYFPEAFLFILQALDVTAKRVARREPPGHVSGRELLEGVRILGLEEFGFLARTVFESWGVLRTRDFGEIVFALVNENLMGKTDRDSMEDFDDVYDFEEAFEKGYKVDWGKIDS